METRDLKWFTYVKVKIKYVTLYNYQTMKM
jgi:hypothetical protein